MTRPEPPDDLRELDRLLRGVQFEPRPSLGAEVVGRWKRGDRPEALPWLQRPWVALLGATLLVSLGLFIFWMFALRPLRYSVDRCCQDLDGGGDADDGVLVVSNRGNAVQSLRIYEDRDHSGNYTPGDPIRFVRQGELSLAGSLAGANTAEFCCLDYDGGGPSDDALVVVRHPPDRISMAGIYEHESPKRPVVLR